MAQTSYPSPDGNNNITDIQYERLSSLGAASGVIGTPADTPVVTAPSTGLVVSLNPGKRAWVRGHVWESDPVLSDTFTVAANTSGSPRIDRFVLGLDRATWNVTGYVLTGTPSPTPALPPLTQDLGASGKFEIPLAHWTIVNNASNIAPADVISEAWYPQPSGIVHCTSATRPTGAILVPGRLIYEVDSGRHYRWDGTTWTFPQPAGVVFCTSTTHPPASEVSEGLVIYETDTNTYYWWNGTAWTLFTSVAINTSNAQTQVFTASGTWTKPANATAVDVVCVGGGGGGGGGGSGTTATSNSGGGGGAGGSLTRVLGIPASALGATVAVTVGAGGAGGTPAAAINTSGNVGGTGGASYFGASAATAYVYADGGAAGSGGGYNVATVTGGAAPTVGMYPGNAGGQGASSNNAVAGGNTNTGAGGGGGGGGNTSTNVANAAANGGYSSVGIRTVAVGGSANPTAAGAAGAPQPAGSGLPGNGGAGGGGFNAAGTAANRNGGNGGLYGGGGGGAGSGVNSMGGPGTGGTGGAGVVIVTTYF